MKNSIAIERATDYITGQTFDVQACGACGLAFTHPAPALMDAYYPSAYRNYGGATLRTLRFLYGRKVRGWMPYLRPRGRALELGCGAGWMLRALRNRGWRVVGSERAIDGARGAAVANQIPVFVGDFDALGAPAGFDLIILFQVLEHLSDPMATLHRSAALLAAGGTVVVAVPNFASWQARVFGRAWFHLDVPRHQNHFSPTVLASALENAGLRIVRTRFVSPEHDPYGWVQSALNRMGFRQNELTKLLMGMEREGAGLMLLPMLLVAGLLVLPSVILSLGSWAAGSGAIMEMWAVKKENG